jgi:hypothetical protein
MEIEHKNEQLTTSQPSKQLSRWIGEQLTILAESFGEVLSPQRLKIYVQDLADIDQGRLAVAFTRARRELGWFPKIAQLRDLAGANDADLRRIESEAAWQFALHYSGEPGVCRPPYFIFDKGTARYDYPPPPPPRVDYAVDRIGGWKALSEMTEKSRPFLRLDFLEAYAQAPLAEVLVPQLLEKFRAQQLSLAQAGELPALPEGEAPDAYEER